MGGSREGGGMRERLPLLLPLQVLLLLLVLVLLE